MARGTIETTFRIPASGADFRTSVCATFSTRPLKAFLTFSVAPEIPVVFASAASFAPFAIVTPEIPAACARSAPLS